MKAEFNKNFLKVIADSQSFGIDDRLSKMLSNGELFEEDLEIVSAAGQPDFNRFKLYFDKTHNK